MEHDVLQAELARALTLTLTPTPTLTLTLQPHPHSRLIPRQAELVRVKLRAAQLQTERVRP